MTKPKISRKIRPGDEIEFVIRVVAEVTDVQDDRVCVDLPYFERDYEIDRYDVIRIVERAEDRE
jgi:uncharacterized protein YkvS